MIARLLLALTPSQFQLKVNNNNYTFYQAGSFIER